MGPLRGREVGHVETAATNPALGRPHEARAGTERRRLPSPVGPDQTGDHPEGRREAQPVDGEHTTEAHRQILDHEPVEVMSPSIKPVFHGAASWRLATGERQGSVTLARPGLRLCRRGDRDRSALTTATTPKATGWKFCQPSGR